MIEKEINTIVTSTEYDKICHFFSVEKQNFITQHNFYYDTPASILKDNTAGLRIRIVDNKAEFTLKETISENEKKETTDYFIIQDINTFSFPMGQVSKLLEQKYHIATSDLMLIGKLVNERYEIKNSSGIWEIDKSYFPTGTSYELSLEYEKDSRPFFELLEKLNITYQKTPPKLARALFPVSHEHINRTKIEELL